MIQPQISGTQIVIVSGHLHAIDMGSEIALRNTAQAFMIHLVSDLPDATVLPQTKHRDLTVMVTTHEEQLILIIRREITAAHTVDRSLIYDLQITARQDLIRLHSEIRDRIEILLIVGDRDIGRVCDLHLIFLRHSSVFQIHIIDLDAVIILFCRRVGRHVRHIFILTHRRNHALSSVLGLF